MANESHRKRAGTAFEVSLDDEHVTVTGVGPARLWRKKRRSPVTAEKLEAKLRQAEERRKAHERARLERIHQRWQECQKIHKLATGFFEYQTWSESTLSKSGQRTVTEQTSLVVLPDPDDGLARAESDDASDGVEQSTQTEGGKQHSTAVQTADTEDILLNSPASDHSDSDPENVFESTADLPDAAYFRFLYAGLQRSLSKEQGQETSGPEEQSTQTMPLGASSKGTQVSTVDRVAPSNESRSSSSQTESTQQPGARPKPGVWSMPSDRQNQVRTQDFQEHCYCCRCVARYQSRDASSQTMDVRPKAFEVPLGDGPSVKSANVPERIRRLSQRRGSASSEELAAKLQKAEERKKMAQQARINRVKQREAECLRVDSAVCRLLKIESTITSVPESERPVTRTEAMRAIKDIVMGMGKIGAELQRDIDFAKTLPSFFSGSWSSDDFP